MSYKNKDLVNLMEKYNNIFSKVLVLESAGGEAVANQVSDEIQNLNAPVQSPEDSPIIAPVDVPEDMLDVVATPKYIPKSSPKYKQTNLDAWSYKTLHMAINDSFAQKQPLLILGDPGIGKSDTVRLFAEQIANGSTKGKYLQESDFDFSTDQVGTPEESTGPREYIDWAEIDLEKKKEVLRNPQNYFLVLELTSTELDRLDIKGIPIAKKEKGEFEYTEYEKSLELYVLTRKGIEGFLFLDEVNLGPLDVRSAFLKLIQKRAVGDDKLSPGLTIIAASNIPGQGGTDADLLSSAFINRMGGGVGVLVADPDQWCDWAESVGVDERIIAFIKENPDDYFYTHEDLETLKQEQRPFASPRSLVAFSKVYNKALKDYYNAIKAGRKPRMVFEDYILERGSKIVGEKWIKGFLSWVDDVRKLEIKEILGRGDLGRNQSGKVKTADVGKIIYFLKAKIKTATNKLLKKGIKIEDSSVWTEEQITDFLNQNVNTDPEVFKYFEGAAMVLTRVKPQWAGLLVRGLNRDLTEYQRRFFFEFLEFGTYDPKTKEEILEKVFKEIEEFIG